MFLVSAPQNEDIDIALDNCTGVAFAEMVNAYLKSQGQDEGKIGVIEVRPGEQNDESKANFIKYIVQRQRRIVSCRLCALYNF